MGMMYEKWHLQFDSKVILEKYKILRILKLCNIQNIAMIIIMLFIINNLMDLIFVQQKENEISGLIKI